MNRNTWWLSPAAFGGAVVLFFLPFLVVTCQGQQVASLTGVQLVTGTSVRDPMSGQQRKQGGEPLAAMALVCAGGGLALGVATRRRSRSHGATIAGCAGAVAMLLLKAKLDGDMAREGQGMLQAQYTSAYWLAVLFLAGGATLAAMRGTGTERGPIPVDSASPVRDSS